MLFIKWRKEKNMNMWTHRVEGGFGIYCQSAGKCNFISLEQITKDLALQRFKLYGKLDFEELVGHSEKKNSTSGLPDNEINEVFLLRGTLRDLEKSSLFYISGYVAFKEGPLPQDSIDDSNFSKTLRV